MDQLTSLIYENEQKLLHNNNPTEQDLQELIADDFIEIASSGRIYNKDFLINYFISSTAEAEIKIENFQIKLLSPEIILSTYLARKKLLSNNEIRLSLRSSIWKKHEGSTWQIHFHQGTKATP